MADQQSLSVVSHPQSHLITLSTPKSGPQEKPYTVPGFIKAQTTLAAATKFTLRMKCDVIVAEIIEAIHKKGQQQTALAVAIFNVILVPTHDPMVMLAGIQPLSEEVPMLKTLEGSRCSSIDPVFHFPLVHLPKLSVLNAGRSVLWYRAAGRLASVYGMIHDWLLPTPHTASGIQPFKSISAELAHHFRQSDIDELAFNMIECAYSLAPGHIAKLKHIVKVGHNFNHFRDLGGDLLLPFIDLELFELIEPATMHAAAQIVQRHFNGYLKNMKRPNPEIVKDKFDVRLESVAGYLPRLYRGEDIN